MVLGLLKSMVTGSERIKTSHRFPLFESKHLSGDNHTIWHTRIEGAILEHGTVTGGPFQVGEIVSGGTSGRKGTVTAVNAGSLTIVNTVKNDAQLGEGTIGYDMQWTDTETITGSVSGASATLSTHDTGAYYYFDYNTSSVRMKVGTLSGQGVSRQNTRLLPYYPGFEQVVEMTEKPEFKTGCTQYYLYGDKNNGIGFKIVDNVVYAGVRTNTSGTVDESSFVPQSKWLDCKKIDFTKAQLGEYTFKWLGYGNYRIWLTSGGKKRLIIDHVNAGVTDDVFMRTPSNHIFYEIKNHDNTASSTEIRQVCCAVFSEGGAALHGNTWSTGINIKNKRAITTLQPVLAIRLKKEFLTGKPNMRAIQFLNAGATAQTNNATLIVCHAHEPLTMTGTWVDFDDSSGIEVSRDIAALTAKHIHEVERFDVLAGQAGKGTSGKIDLDLSNHSYISQNPESDCSEIIVIYAQAETGTSDISCHISWKESE